MSSRNDKTVGTIEIPTDYLTNAEYQKETIEHIESMKVLAQEHILNSVFAITNGIDKSLPCFKQPTDPEFELPSKEVVSKTVGMIMDRGYSKTEISEFIGISATGSNRLLNYWISEKSDRHINKANWLIMASLAGLILPLMARKKD